MISSIDPDTAAIGRCAARTLLELIETPSLAQKSIVRQVDPVGVVERASTQDLRGVGRIASLANEIIRNEVFSGLTVGDLAKQLNISRTLLQNYYRTVHGITVRERLREMRLERIKELLETTPKPIADIAAEAGFRTLVAAQVAFRSLTGQTMREWRNAKYERGNPRA